MKKRNKHRSSQKSPAVKLACAVGISAICSLLCFFALLLICSGACILAAKPHSLLLPLALASVYLSSFVSGFLSVLLNQRNNKLLSATLGGVCFTIILFLLLLPFKTVGESGNLILKFLSIPIAILGGYCVPKRQSHRKHRK